MINSFSIQEDLDKVFMIISPFKKVNKLKAITFEIVPDGTEQWPGSRRKKGGRQGESGDLWRKMVEYLL
jgi:hypothetical protein